MDINTVDIDHDMTAMMLRQCPITSGRPTRMTQKGFYEACAAKRGELAKHRKRPWGGQKYRKYCDECQGGNIPAELEFVTMDELRPMGAQSRKKEEGMGVESKPGKCVFCGKDGSVRMHFGEECCSTCINLRVVAKNRPELVVRALQQFSPGALDPTGVANSWAADDAALLAEIVDMLGTGEAPIEEYLRALDMAYDAERARMDYVADVLKRNGAGGLPVGKFIDGLGAACEIEMARALSMEQELATANKALGAFDWPGDEKSMARELRTHLGMTDDQGAADIIDAVALLSQTIERYKRNNEDLRTANELLHELVTEKTNTNKRLVEQISLSRPPAPEPFEVELPPTMEPKVAAISINTFDLLHDLSWLLAGLVIGGADFGPGKEHLEALNEVLDRAPVTREAA